MPIELPGAWITGLNIGGWLVIQVGLAWLFIRLPTRWFAVAAPRPAATQPRFYERALGIRRWKDRLPDGATWFGGGFAKRMRPGADGAYLERLIRETRRGEWCHWVAMGAAPVFFVWNPWWGDLIIVGYAVAANLPCVLAQRYNRGRLVRLQARQSARLQRASG